MPRGVRYYDAIARDVDDVLRILDDLYLRYEPIAEGYVRVRYPRQVLRDLQKVPGVWIYWSDIPEPVRDAIEAEVPWFEMKQPV